VASVQWPVASSIGFVSQLARVPEFAEGFIVGALRSGGVARQFVEGVSGAAHSGQDAGIGVGVSTWFGQDLFEREGFEALDSEQATAGLDHLVDEEAFVFAVGLELVAQAAGEAVEVFGILVGEDGEDAGGPVLSGVPRGGGFAFQGFRASGKDRVLLVGSDLG
jgi:hypothetical protein